MFALISIPTKEWTSCVLPGTDIATLKCIPIILENVINTLLFFSAIVALFLIIYSGVQFITSSGDPQKVESSRKTLTFAIVGLVFIILSFAGLKFIENIAGVIGKIGIGGG